MVCGRDGDHSTHERQGYLDPNTEVHGGPYPRQVPWYNFQEEGLVLDRDGDNITYERQGYLTPTTEGIIFKIKEWSWVEIVVTLHKEARATSFTCVYAYRLPLNRSFSPKQTVPGSKHKKPPPFDGRECERLLNSV